MSNIYQGTLGLIGNTPLVELTHVEKAYGLEARLLAKLEYFLSLIHISEPTRP